MKLRSFSAFSCALALLVIFLQPVQGLTAAKPEALPVPKEMIVKSAKGKAELWDKLNLHEKRLAYHLLRAAAAGRYILFSHSHRHALLMKDLLETAFRAENITATENILGTEGLNELLNYTAKFEDMVGPYEVSNRKYVLKVVTMTQVHRLFATYLPKTPHAIQHEVGLLMTHPDYEVTQFPEDPSGEGLEDAGGNFYDHTITLAELNAALAGGMQVCLNCRVIRGANGELALEVQTVNTPGVVGEALKKAVIELKEAQALGLTEQQQIQIGYLIKFFEEGNIEDFRQFNIAWVRDGSSSVVDFMMGMVEIYQDFRGQIGSWESYIQVVDPEMTAVSKKLAESAQYFEDHMPYGKWKKTFPKGYSPPALMVFILQEISSMHIAGYNLPNYDDIRRDVGAKNIIRLDLPGEKLDPEAKKRFEKRLRAFVPADRVAQTLEGYDKSRQVLVLLHEIIGHGSGTYDEEKYPNKVDPISALGSLGSALEEQRADLTALVFASDPELVAAGIYQDQAEADLARKVMYDSYLYAFAVSVAKERSLVEAHLRGHWLFLNFLFDAGAIEWVAADGGVMTDDNRVLRVKDYDLFHQVSVDLLGKLQLIKATRDEEGLKDLFTRKAPLKAIEEPWAKAMIARGEKIQLSNSAIEQPWTVGKDLQLVSLCEDTLLRHVAGSWHKQ